VLTPPGYARVFTGDDAAGYGYPGQEDLLLLNLQSSVNVPGEGFHLAFAAPGLEEVACFHQEALKHGGRCNGPAGPRPDYGEDYYAAFVIDPDGYRIEAVFVSGK
jgi:catechol 2,3-dioxygenase-like lactoylglutathione lyase family enzyme